MHVNNTQMLFTHPPSLPTHTHPLDTDVDGSASSKDGAIDVESFFKSLGAPTSPGSDDAAAAGLESDLELEDGGDGDPTRSAVAKPMDRMSDKETLISRGWRTPTSWISQVREM